MLKPGFSNYKAGGKNSTRTLLIMSEIYNGWVILPK